MKWRKCIPPVVVTLLVCAWLLFYVLAVLVTPGLPGWMKGLGLVVPLLIGGVAIYNLVERIHEIRSDEKDDLDNY